MRTRTRVLGGLGAILTLAAAAVLVRPDLTDSLSGVVSILESQDPERLLLVLGTVVGAYAAWVARASSTQRPTEDGPTARFAGVGDPPEAVSAADRTRTGASFDHSIAAACSGDESALDHVRSTLAETAAGAYARAADRPHADARRAVETGAWTDDPVAAAFLAGESGPTFSLWARLRAWLDREAERRRRIDRTVEAVGQVLETVGQTPDTAGHEPDTAGQVSETTGQVPKTTGQEGQEADADARRDAERETEGGGLR